MGFKGNRIYVIIALFFIAGLIVVIGIAASSNPAALEPTATPTSVPDVTMPPVTVTVTINSEIGIKQVSILNLNTGKTIIKQLADLPCALNVNRDDTLRFYVQTETSYKWNAWELSVYPWWDNSNSMTLKITQNVDLFPNCDLQEAPTE